MLAFASAGVCQTEPAPENDPTASDTPEEITVYGKKTIMTLRREFYMAQENLFTLFNSLNSDDQYDIECEYVTPLGGRKKYHVCTPKFVRLFEPLPNAAWDMMMDTADVSRPPPPGPLQEKHELLWKEMAALVLKHPEMQQAVSDLSKVKAEYDAARQE